MKRYLWVNLSGPGPSRMKKKKNLRGPGLTKVEKHCSVGLAEHVSDMCLLWLRKLFSGKSSWGILTSRSGLKVIWPSSSYYWWLVAEIGLNARNRVARILFSWNCDKNRTHTHNCKHVAKNCGGDWKEGDTQEHILKPQKKLKRGLVYCLTWWGILWKALTSFEENCVCVKLEFSFVLAKFGGLRKSYMK
jgi:hypothetical protein